MPTVHDYASSPAMQAVLPRCPYCWSAIDHDVNAHHIGGAVVEASHKCERTVRRGVVTRWTPAETPGDVAIEVARCVGELSAKLAQDFCDRLPEGMR